ncbi:ABATE domain-containing protein [Nocardiopsis sp. HNM0947]|uniref:ABATE domain-containing protein n=1 Tax=Nocardiopsis coralli TaxID=2772213 RepID=A0ABR9P185_9ACTN|nr:ABATE domain-containing protein [Nocardiopsis coralli]MBE2997608.1 ABATE domain-containing protein [Nocardiopsis coralli]
MSTPTQHSTAAALVSDFVTSGEALGDRADLARFMREHGLVTEGAIPITLADLDEAVTLREGLREALRGPDGDPEAVARGQKVLDGLRVTVRITPEPEAASVLAPAVVDEVRRGLARVAGAWATVLATGEWRTLRP